MHQQTPLAGLCWPSGVVGPSSLVLNPATQTNPSMTLAILASMRGTGAPNAGFYSPAAAAAAATTATPIYSTLADPVNFHQLLSGYYPFTGPTSPASSTTSAIVSSPYNSVEVKFIHTLFLFPIT